MFFVRNSNAFAASHADNRDQTQKRISNCKAISSTIGYANFYVTRFELRVTRFKLGFAAFTCSLVSRISSLVSVYISP